jgi:hypothetical protein
VTIEWQVQPHARTIKDYIIDNYQRPTHKPQLHFAVVLTQLGTELFSRASNGSSDCRLQITGITT